MPSLCQTIVNLWFNTTGKKPSAAAEPTLCIYEQRIKCFEILSKLQKDIKLADNEYINVSIIEGKVHENALNRMELYTKEYRKEYGLCEKIMKY